MMALVAFGFLVFGFISGLITATVLYSDTKSGESEQSEQK